MSRRNMLYFPDDLIQEMRPSTEDILRMAKHVVQALARSDIVTAPRPTIDSRAGTRFMAFPAVMEDVGVAGVKWLGATYGSSSDRGGGSVIVLSEIARAEPFAIFDGQWITAIRTAVVSLLAAEVMARCDSHRMAFIGCGQQARLHLEVFRKHFAIHDVAAFSRTLLSAERFSQEAQGFDLNSQTHSSVEECVRGADIVISATSSRAETAVRADWLADTCFYSLVDLGRSFAPDSLGPDGLFVVDDLAQYAALVLENKVAQFPKTHVVSLYEALQQRMPIHRRGGFFMPTGLGAIDIKIANELYRAAHPNGIGIPLRR